LQEINPDLERRGSKNNISPSSTIFGFFGLCASMGWIGSSADIAGGAAMLPIASSDTIIVRNIIVDLPKNTAVVAQPIRLQIIRYRTSCCYLI
jgi:hypothetical protein